MFVERITALGARFLSDRSFTLIVAPAIADFEFDRAEGRRAPSHLSVLRAMAGAAYEDVTQDASGTLTFLAVALLPACYYTFLFILCLPPLQGVAVTRVALVLGALILTLSTVPAIICYWPEPLSRPIGEQASPEAS